MSRKFGVALVSAFTLGALFVREAHAANLGSAALYAYAGHYNLDPNSTDPAVGSMCVNQSNLMPPTRSYQCGYPVVTQTATGRYTITVSHGAPLPSSPNDHGYAVWVQAVGSNAHCYEESTTATGLPGWKLTSKVRCVAPSSNANTNTDVDSEFAWSYRTDSWEWLQDDISVPNYGYARVNRADGTLVHAQTYFPVMNFDVQSTRTSTGQYTVVFKNLNPADVFSVNGYIGNVIVQKTCSNDSAAECKRAVCIPHSWTQGTYSVYDTTVNVRCYGANGALRDTDFRVFAGDEGHNSQQVFSGGGGRYVWLNYTNTSTTNTCFPLSNFLYRGQHESPYELFPTGPIQVCKNADGRFTVNLDSSNFIGVHYIAPYHVDDISPVVSSREGAGVYCNPHKITCNSGNCKGGDSLMKPASQIEVRCYNPNGTLRNAAFNLSMYY